MSLENCKSLIKQDDKLFSDRMTLVSLWQELAENFNPNRADFTASYTLGQDWASYLTTSAPLLSHRELGGMISTVLRPYGKDWFYAYTSGYDDLTEESKRYIELQTHILRNAMYDPDAYFNRSQREADDDIALIGNSVTSCVMNWKKNSLLFNTHHVRDVCWWENYDRSIARISRKDKQSIMTLNQKFKGNISEKLKKRMEKDPYAMVDIRHCFIEAELYDYSKNKKNKKYASIWYDCENQFIMEELFTDVPMYSVSRWKTLSCSQYGYSPATTASLPDARLVQDMMLVLLEAGQKAVDPPMIAVTEALRSDVGLYAGAITSVDAEYDERLGEVLRPLTQNMSGIPLGLDMMASVKQMIDEAHYLGKLGLPPLGGGMSPFEVSQRVTEYVRNGLTLLDPLESERNNSICTLAYEVGKANGLFGDPRLAPEELVDKKVEFKFKNPLVEASEKIKGSMLQEAIGIISQVMAVDPDAAMVLDTNTSMRDALEGIGSPRDWFRTKDEVDQMKAAKAEAAQMQNMMMQIQQGAQTAQDVGKAGQELQAISGAV